MDYKTSEICRICLLHNENLINIHQNELAQNIMTITTTKVSIHIFYKYYLKSFFFVDRLQ